MHDPSPGPSTSLAASPPRQNANGLPPRYRALLRDLLHQWIDQQKGRTQGLPGSIYHQHKLWPEAKARQLEDAIWQHVVVVQRASGRRGLLQLDWDRWITLAMRRLGAYQLEEAGRPSLEKAASPAHKTVKSLQRASRSDVEAHVRNRLSSSPTPAAFTSLMGSSTATPIKPSARPMSITSARSTPRPDEFSDQLAASLKRASSGSSGGSDVDESTERLCETLKTLPGYKALDEHRREDWEVVNSGRPMDPHTSLPGAFPQTGVEDDAEDSPSPEPSPASDSTADCTMLKPVFCLRFAPPSSSAPSNTSTVRMNDLSGTGSNHSSNGWWGSGRRWSDMTARPGAADDDFSIAFVEGKFALPTDSQVRSPTAGIAPDDSTISMTESASSVESGASGPSVANWFEAPHTAGQPPTQAVNIIIGGSRNDIPQEVDIEQVGLVGGTFVVRGMSDPDEQWALEQILQRLLYTTQSMVIELGLLDAFRVPRESEPHESPPKADPFVGPKSAFGRRNSLKEGEGKKGFFGRLHKDTRGVIGGLFRNRKHAQVDAAEDFAKSHRSTPSFDSLGIPATPVGAVYDGIPGTPTRSSQLRPTPPKETSYGYSAIDDHLELLARLESMKMSTTPGLVLTPPVLLTRVKEEERLRVERASRSLPSSLVALDQDRPSSDRIGGDVRIGLKAIRPGMDGFDGWPRLQRLDTVRCLAVDEPAHAVESDPESPPATVCERPQEEAMIFYDPNHDLSLLAMLHKVKEGMADMAACSRSGCVATAHDHKTCWYHAESKVTLRAERLVDLEESGDKVEAWVSCSICGTASDSAVMSDLAAYHSWGKLLELLIYSEIVRPAKLCGHNEPHQLKHHLRTSGISATVSVEPFTVLDTRLPYFQVGPPIPKRKNVPPVSESPPRPCPNEADLAEKHALVAEVEAYLAGINEAICALEDDIVALIAKHVDDGEPEKGLLVDKGIRDIRNDLFDCGTSIDARVLGDPKTKINDCRIYFIEYIRKTDQSLAQYQKEFAIPDPKTPVHVPRPYYYEGPVHALPGSDILVHEDDPASIIAYTLSSLAYVAELTSSAKPSTDAARPDVATGNPSSNDTWTIDIKRRDNPKDLFALRGLTKKQSSMQPTPTKPIVAMTVTPTTPSLELSLEQVIGRPEPADNLSELVKSISKAAAQDPVLSVRAHSPNISPRLLDDGLPGVLVHPTPTRPSRRPTIDHSGLPPSSFKPIRSGSSSISSLPVTPQPSDESSTPVREGWGSVSSVSNALYKFGSGMGEALGSLRMRTGERSLSSMLGPLSAMSQADNALANSASNQLPHIQFTYSLGDKIKLGCTVYHAEPFDVLRRRCAIDKAIIASLRKVENWDAAGGKSKAVFFRTDDRRFVIKELVSKWTASDTNAMLELSPQYFEYMQSTFNKATSLIKIVGFYSVMTYDRASGSNKKMDLLIMEDLFHKQDISRTFDLKGIEGRKMPKPAAASTAGETKVVGPETLFDADWLEGMARSPILLHPHAKRILHEAITADTRFLSAQAVMDYSLLLGLDKGRSELVVGIVDSIGSYNLWKTIESRGKLALTRGAEVTVIPPDQYKQRFQNALNSYFIACPDKWSKTQWGKTIRQPAHQLTSFL